MRKRKTVSKRECGNCCNGKLKKAYGWLKNVGRVALANTVYNMDSAYKKFLNALRIRDILEMLVLVLHRPEWNGDMQIIRSLRVNTIITNPIKLTLRRNRYRTGVERNCICCIVV